jgi:hypothetical protein
MDESASRTKAEGRALQAASELGIDPANLELLLLKLEQLGLQLVDTSQDLICRWVDTRERLVPPTADTIIRTLTNRIGGQTWSATYWLEGLRAPAMPGPG